MFDISLAFIMAGNVAQQVQDVSASVAIIAASIGGLMAAWSQARKPAKATKPKVKPKAPKKVVTMSQDDIDELGARR